MESVNSTVLQSGWVPQPNCGRGTLDIVWTCLLVIFACVWTVLHPNLRKSEGFLHFGHKNQGCLLAVLAPEYLVYNALISYLAVKRAVKRMKKLNYKSCTMEQAFFVMMGGVQILLKDGTRSLGEFREPEFDRVNALFEFQKSLDLGLLSLSQLSHKDIKARSKSNNFVKALVCVQAAWLITQVVGRYINELAITTLEVTAAGYAVCAFMAYICWWSKPQDAEVPVVVECRDYTIGEFSQLLYPGAEEPPVQKEQIGNPRIEVSRPLSSLEMESGTSEDRHNDIEARTSSDVLQALHTQVPEQTTSDDILLSDSVISACNLVMSLFGAIHCAAWNFHFPSAAESILWKVSSFLTMVLPVLIGYYLDRSWHASNLWNVGGIVMSFIYVPVRLYLLVGVFAGLRLLPISAYQNVLWATWIPHV